MTISLCIIARNEADFLGRCIESAKPVVDEIIVVDTGSNDRTPEIAKQRGARVFHYQWPGDYAQAYNLPLAHACGEWILTLDADEALDPGKRPIIKQLTKDSVYDGYFFIRREYSYSPTLKWQGIDSLDPLAFGARGWCSNRLLRLFRNHPEHCYSGEVHQSVLPSILRRGGRVGESEVIIHHYGLLRFDCTYPKLSRYLELVRKKIANQPENARALIELGTILLNKEDWKPALDAFYKASSLGYGPGAAFYLGCTFLEMNEPAKAVGYLKKAIQENPRYRDVDFDLADAWTYLGRAHEALGQESEAEECYRYAICMRPDSPVATNNLAGLLNQREELDEAAQILKDLLFRYPGLSMPRATLGANRLRGGDFEGALEAFEKALFINPENLPARINLALTLKLLGRSKESKKAYILAKEVLGSKYAWQQGLSSYIPPIKTTFNRRRRPKALKERVVVSLIPHLAGGAGRVLTDVVIALQDRPQLVLCGDPGSYEGLWLRREVEERGIEVQTVSSSEELGSILKQVRAAVVLHHWWVNRLFPEPLRVGDERWVAIGHVPQPMPQGYDTYVTLSDFHALFQTHLPLKQIRRIPNGIDCSRFKPKEDGVCQERPVTIAMLSRLEPGKFPRRLVFYLPQLEKIGARVVIAGRGARQVEIEPELEGLGLANVVKFIGPVPSKKVPEFLTGADIGLHLTETHRETGAIAVLEMMAAGLPVVAQPTGCIPELVIDGENGFLADTEEEIAERLRELVLYPSIRKQMGKASQQHSEQFDINRFRSSYRALVEELAHHIKV